MHRASTTNGSTYFARRQTINALFIYKKRYVPSKFIFTSYFTMRSRLLLLLCLYLCTIETDQQIDRRLRRPADSSPAHRFIAPRHAAPALLSLANVNPCALLTSLLQTKQCILKQTMTWRTWRWIVPGRMPCALRFLSTWIVLIAFTGWPGFFFLYTDFVYSADFIIGYLYVKTVKTNETLID